MDCVAGSETARLSVCCVDGFKCSMHDSSNSSSVNIEKEEITAPANRRETGVSSLVCCVRARK